MLKSSAIAAVAVAALAITIPAHPAFAHDGGAVAAGVVGGLAVGAIIGSQANRSYYSGPGYYEPTYQPVYSNCRVERQRFEDQYGRMHVRRIRVCD